MFWPQNLKKYDLCWEEGAFFLEGLVVCSWDRKEEWEIGDERVGIVVTYSLLPMTSPTNTFDDDSIGKFDGELVTSLYGDLGLNPLVILLIKSLAKSSTSANRLFFNYEYSVSNSVGIYRLNYRRNSVRR